LENNIQWQYGYGRTLPADPPPDFTASAGIRDGVGGRRHPRALLAQSATRLAICRLHGRRITNGCFNWTTDWIQNGGDALHRLFERLGN